MVYINSIARINIVYSIGAVYTGLTAAIAWLGSSAISKVITDSCDSWIKPISNETQTLNNFLQESSKQEICKWAPFISDVVVVAGTFQLLGMGLYGVGFRVTNIETVKYGIGGISNCLMNFIVDHDISDSSTDFSGDLRTTSDNSPGYKHNFVKLIKAWSV